MYKVRISSLIFFVSIFFGFNSKAQVSLEPNFEDELVLSGWNQAVGIVYDSTGQSYVWELKGKIWVIDTNGNKLPNALLNISEEVGNWRGHGLHGVCLDPNFRTNGYFYCYYAVDRYYLLNYGNLNYNKSSNQYFNASILRVSRFTADINTNFTTLVPNSKLVLIGETKKTGIPLVHDTHDGGTILFGKDGSLLVFTGDDADYGQNDVGSAPGTYWSQALADTIIRTAENVGSFRAQLLNCLNGKILRIDPNTGNGLASNPFYDTGNPRSPQSRVYALGLRQPYRCTIKPETGSTDINLGNPGTLIVSDVGWSTWESFWFVDKPGQNLGWPIFEGLNRVSAYQSPVYNRDAPNPLNGTNTCTNQPYFSFQNLLVNSESATPSFPNPCNNNVQIPASTPKFKWFAPLISYKHGINQTEVPIVSGDSVQPVALTNALSNVVGSEFSGNTSMAGPWYTGQNFPNNYNNSYFNFDYGTQWIKNFKLDSNNKVLEARPFASNLGEIVYLTMNQKDGCLYYLRLEGELRKICYDFTNDAPPTAVITIDSNYSGTATLNVIYSGANSIDPEGGSLTYLWDFGNGDTDTNIMGSKTLVASSTNPETRTIKLTVTDQVNKSTTDSVQISLNNYPPIVNISSINDSALYSIGEPQVVDLIANVIDNEADSTLTYNWEAILFHEEHTHPEPVDQDHITYTVLSTDGCGSEKFWWEIKLSVIDAQGLKGTDKVRLFPDCSIPDAKIISPDTACKAATVTFNDGSYNATSRTWVFENGIPSTSNAKNPQVTFSVNGVFKVILIAQNSLGADTTVKFITIRSNTMALGLTFTPNDTVCKGDSIILGINGAAGATSYQWYNGTTKLNNETNFNLNSKVTGNYKVLVSDHYGCVKFSKTQKLNVLSQIATIKAFGSTNICVGDSVKISANQIGNYTYQWTKNNVLIPDASAIDYYAKSTGTFKCIVTNALGCSKLSTSGIKVKITCKIEDHDKTDDAGISISPNPVVNALNVGFTVGDENEIYFTVVDVLGREVMRTNPVKYGSGNQSLTIDVSKLGKGLYLLVLNSATTNEKLSFEIVNEK